MAVPEGIAARPLPAPTPKQGSGRGLLWGAAIVIVLGLLGGAAFLWKPWAPTADKVVAPQASPKVEKAHTVPPSLQVELEKALAGDVHSMRFLGTCFKEGLNVPRDPEEAEYWFKRAAEAGGSKAAEKPAQPEGKAK